MDVKSWADGHQEWFYERHRLDGGLKPIPPTNGWAGRWDKDDWKVIGFHPTRLKEILRECRYEPEAILATWKERGWLDLEDSRAGYTKRFRIGGELTYLIAISRRAFAELEPGAADENNGNGMGQR